MELSTALCPCDHSLADQSNLSPCFSPELCPFNLSNHLKNACSALYAFDHKDDRVFCFQVRKGCLPSAQAKFEAFGWCPVSKLAKSKHAELRAAIESDIQVLMTRANALAQTTKTIYGEALPTNPNECAEKLKGIKERKKGEIKELEHELELIDEAVYTMEVIQKNQEAAKALCMPPAKKQKI